MIGCIRCHGPLDCNGDCFFCDAKMNDADREAASSDARHFGAAWLRIDADGTAHRIDPADVYIKPEKN